MEGSKKFKRVPAGIPVSSLTPLEISCTSTKCEDRLHCFRLSKKRAEKLGRVCRECGANLIDWNRVHRRRIQDAEFVFDEMKKELIRHVYWHMPIKDKDLRSALADGKEKIEHDAHERISRVLGVAHPFRNGITPYYGNIIFYGQHATASCCRVCMEYWHGIPQGRPLEVREVDYLAKLVMLFVGERVPEIMRRTSKRESVKSVQ